MSRYTDHAKLSRLYHYNWRCGVTNSAHWLKNPALLLGSNKKKLSICICVHLCKHTYAHTHTGTNYIYAHTYIWKHKKLAQIVYVAKEIISLVSIQHKATPIKILTARVIPFYCQPLSLSLTFELASIM